MSKPKLLILISDRKGESYYDYLEKLRNLKHKPILWKIPNHFS